MNGKGKEAVELFNKIPIEMINDRICVCVLNACSHSGLIEEAEEIFNRLPDERKTERTYTSMVSMRNIHFLSLIFAETVLKIDRWFGSFISFRSCTRFN